MPKENAPAKGLTEGLTHGGEVRSEKRSKKTRFLEELARFGNVTRACEKVGVSRVHMYECRKNSPEFAAQWEEALRIGNESLEDEARRRALEGVDKPVFYQGEECGVVKEYSDSLLAILLKANHPEKFKDRSATEITGQEDKPVGVSVVFVKPEKKG